MASFSASWSMQDRAGRGFLRQNCRTRRTRNGRQETMFTARNKRSKGFTIIEALVALTLAGIGVAGAIEGIRSLTKSQTRMLEGEHMHRLAFEKYQEIIATQDLTTPSGDFGDRNESGFTWEME